LAVKNGMAQDASGHPHFPAFPQSITYDMRGLSAEIGPDKRRRQGALGNISVLRDVEERARVEHRVRLEREAPGFEKALGEAAAKALRW
jgi:hypothetical protein